MPPRTPETSGSMVSLALAEAFDWTTLLTCPARVGEPSRNFLAWNGTELICAGGHGFMHVPEMATSWFGTQRWLHLDPSWSGLFLAPVKALDL